MKSNPHSCTLDSAIAIMSASSVPSKVSCRVDEKTMIVEFIRHGLKKGSSNASLYVAGMTGTGKTSITTQTVLELKQDEDFEFLSINVMNLDNSNQIYQKIYASITGLNASAAKAGDFLDSFFKKPNKLAILHSELSKKVSKEDPGLDQEVKRRAQVKTLVLIDEID